MTILIVYIKDTRNDTEEVRELGPWHAAFPIDIGADPTCGIQLVAPGVEARHVRYLAISHHRFLEVLAEGAMVQCFGKEVHRGDQRRIDYQPFSVGPFQLMFGERRPESHEP
ncbi:MAG: hypothetical protein ABI134_27125 [Byssovorax sp.]